MIAAILLSSALRADCFCGESGWGSKGSGKVELSDFLSFFEFSVERLRSFGLKFPESEIAIQASEILSLGLAEEEGSHAVDFFFRLVSVVPVKITIARVKDESRFRATFAELRNPTMEGEMVFIEAELKGVETLDLLPEFCRFFKAGLTEILAKNFAVQFDKLLVPSASDENEKKCLAQSQSFGVYVRKQLVIDQALAVRSRVKAATPEETKDFETELDQLIRLVDSQEKLHAEHPLARLRVPSSMNDLSGFSAFAQNSDDQVEEIDLEVANPQEKKELSLEDSLKAEIMRKPVSRAGKVIFIRNEMPFVERENIGSFTELDEGEGLEEIMEEEAELGNVSQKFNCDIHTSGGSKYYVGLFDSLAPVRVRTKKDDMPRSQDSESTTSKSVIKVFSDSLDARLTGLKIVYSSSEAFKVAKALVDGKQVLRTVNGFESQVPLTLHQKQEVLKWIINCYQLVKKVSPRASFTVYSDYSIYFQDQYTNPHDLLHSFKEKLKLATERDALVTFHQTGHSASLHLAAGNLKVPLAAFNFKPEKASEEIKI